jgi:hypothetical protein
METNRRSRSAHVRGSFDTRGPENRKGSWLEPLWICADVRSKKGSLRFEREFEWFEKESHLLPPVELCSRMKPLIRGFE